ncbi:protein phosphatase 1 regulatory subunit 14C isoform X2 [Tamandua tetradactyla]|uniref:protein phosphatase 1 regulatory subunit 14C isoform X2 n=1 Tax=Tamandua tetradactyla TaxID=48850 RepID=UPI0040548213
MGMCVWGGGWGGEDLSALQGGGSRGISGKNYLPPPPHPPHAVVSRGLADTGWKTAAARDPVGSFHTRPPASARTSRAPSLFARQEEEMPDVEIDIDDLLDAASDEERALKLQEALVDCYKPTEEFIKELLSRIRGMRKLSPPQKKSI